MRRYSILLALWVAMTAAAPTPLSAKNMVRSADRDSPRTDSFPYGNAPSHPEQRVPVIEYGDVPPDPTIIKNNVPPNQVLQNDLIKPEPGPAGTRQGEPRPPANPPSRTNSKEYKDPSGNEMDEDIPPFVDGLD